jgi:hypothetical protein
MVEVKLQRPRSEPEPIEGTSGLLAVTVDFGVVTGPKTFNPEIGSDHAKHCGAQRKIGNEEHIADELGIPTPVVGETGVVLALSRIEDTLAVLVFILISVHVESR